MSALLEKVEDRIGPPADVCRTVGRDRLGLDISDGHSRDIRGGQQVPARCAKITHAKMHIVDRLFARQDEHLKALLLVARKRNRHVADRLHLRAAPRGRIFCMDVAVPTTTSLRSPTSHGATCPHSRGVQRHPHAPKRQAQLQQTVIHRHAPHCQAHSVDLVDSAAVPFSSPQLHITTSQTQRREGRYGIGAV